MSKTKPGTSRRRAKTAADRKRHRDRKKARKLPPLIEGYTGFSTADGRIGGYFGWNRLTPIST